MDEVMLKDGRQGCAMPWCAQSPQPWRSGYTRLFIEFTADELRHATGGKRGHIQIVRNDKFKRTQPEAR